MRFLKLLRETRLHHSEADKQASEKQDFSGQEQPHTNLAGIELLLHGGEMMLMMRIVRVAVAGTMIAMRILMKIDGRSTHACFFTFGR